MLPVAHAPDDKHGNFVRGSVAGRAGFLTCFAVSLGAMMVPMGAAHAQETESRAVVQPLPPAGVSDLNSALRRLAANSRDVNALIDAGNASLQIDDVDAAVGFFGRADELSPNNPRVKVGLAGASVRQERPIEALRLFEEAERAGAPTAQLAGDRGLAYDLVGDNASAQQFYKQALARAENAETRRRLALSHAIAGNRAAFDAVLGPLLEKRSFPAYRTRAFGLAILGEEDEAVEIAEAVMPRDLSRRISPYLRYMPRLTKAQQAAAANLGIFPRAAQIGRDNPRIAQYAGNRGSAGSAAGRLAPQGTPLGQPAEPPVRVARAETTNRQQVPQSTAKEPAVTQRAERVRRRAASDPMQRTRNSVRVVKRAEASEPAREQAPAVAAAPANPAPTPARVAATASPPQSELPPATQVAAVSPPQTTAAQTIPPAAVVPAQTAAAAPVAEPVTSPAQTVLAEVAAPGFDLANVGPAATSTQSPSVQQAPAQIVQNAVVQPIDVPPSVPAAAATPTVQKVAPSVADAFSDFAAPAPVAANAGTGGVDITSITPPREVEREAEREEAAEPAKPEHPRRFWVQIATGRDRSALKFDWRRISRKADGVLDGKSPHAATWGQTNRLLAGPYETARAARNAMNSLKSSEIDSFTFTSSEGQEVDPLN